MFAIEAKKIELLIIQASPFCNIDCKYCYLNDRQKQVRIGNGVVDQTIIRLINDNLIGEELKVLWHAGEPLTVSREIYKRNFNTISLLLSKSIKINNHFQTNATLVTEDWCKFIIDNDIKIGISIDGPQFLTDINRVTKHGKSVYNEVMKGIHLLNKYNIKYSALAVITRQSLPYYKEIYDFFSDLNVSGLGLNFEQVEGVNLKSSLQGTSDNVDLEVRKFYENLYNYYLNSQKKIRIREFQKAKSVLFTLPFDYFHNNNNLPQESHPFSVISIDYQGNFSTFSPQLLGQRDSKYEDFILGNVFKNGFLECSTTEKFENLYSSILDGIAKCRSDCDYFFACGGGTPSSKYYENSTFNSSETMFCKFSRKIPIDILLNEIEK